MRPRCTGPEWPAALLALGYGLVFAACGCGCGAPEDRREPSPHASGTPGPGGTFARLELKAVHHWTPARGEPESRLELWGTFVQHVGVDERLARTQLGIAAAESGLEPGQCRPLRTAAAPTALPLGDDPEDDEVAVELLDAGALYVVVPGQSTLVRPALYPDVLPHVSGVHYRATLSTVEEGLSLNRVSLQGFGGRDVGTFEVMRRAGPADFRLLHVAGSPPGEAPFAVRATQPLALRWAPANSDAQVRVRLRWQAGLQAAGSGVECRPSRAGVFEFRPADLLPARPGAAGRDVTIQVAATRREAFRLPDGTPAALYLTASDAVTLTLVP